MTRLVSLGLASAISLLILTAPFLLAARMTPVVHAVLPLALLGVAGCFVHGVGYRPDRMALRVLFSPLLAWPLAGLYLALVAGRWLA